MISTSGTANPYQDYNKRYEEDLKELDKTNNQANSSLNNWEQTQKDNIYANYNTGLTNAQGMQGGAISQAYQNYQRAINPYGAGAERMSSLGINQNSGYGALTKGLAGQSYYNNVNNAQNVYQQAYRDLGNQQTSQLAGVQNEKQNRLMANQQYYDNRKSNIYQNYLTARDTHLRAQQELNNVYADLVSGANTGKYDTNMITAIGQQYGLSPMQMVQANNVYKNYKIKAEADAKAQTEAEAKQTEELKQSVKAEKDKIYNSNYAQLLYLYETKQPVDKDSNKLIGKEEALLMYKKDEITEGQYNAFIVRDKIKNATTIADLMKLLPEMSKLPGKIDPSEVNAILKMQKDKMNEIQKAFTPPNSTAQTTNTPILDTAPEWAKNSSSYGYGRR